MSPQLSPKLLKPRADFDTHLGIACMNVIADCTAKGVDLHSAVYMLQETMLRQICWLDIESQHELNNGACNSHFAEFANLCRRLEVEYKEAMDCIHRDKDRDDA